MEREICYTKHKQVICHHYNNKPETVTLTDNGDEVSGVCTACGTEFIYREEGANTHE